ncbi:MAG: BatA domain-containing protein [Ignavibacteriae bacterium]|nr:BatA domain-containing protein [Ignavibacteriota bacterium]
MTFLNPLVLFGLIAAAIPVILHLLNLRKLRTIEFSTLTFLKELQQTKIRRLKLRQLLLLFIRTLLIVSIIFAFARPALRGTILGSIGTHAHSSVVIVLDDSFSMMSSDEQGELFKQAKESAEKLIDLLKEGDEVFLIRLSDLPKATIEPATHDFNSLRTIVNESQLSAIRKPLEQALRLSARLLQQSQNANKEVYIISDLQNTLFLDKEYQSDERSYSLFDQRIKMFLIDVAKGNTANVAIDSVEVTTKIIEKDKPFAIFTSVRNFSSTSHQNYVVSAFLDDIRVAQNNISLEPWGSASVQFTVTPKRNGYIKGYIEVEHDAIEPDDRRYFTLHIPERINIALVTGSDEDVQFVKLALQAGTQGGNQSLFTVQQTSPLKFSLLDLNQYDVLVFANVKSFSVNDLNRIESFVKNGGGLILFPGSDIDREYYNSTLLSTLHIPPIENIIGSLNQHLGLSIQEIDLDHPLFATVFEKEQQGRREEHRTIESPTITRMLKRQAGKQAHTIILLSDGTPFLTEHTLGDGKILFFSVAPILSWSDFPLKALFAPLMYRSSIYTATHGEFDVSFTAGDEPIIQLPERDRASIAKQYKVIAPDDVEELIQPAQISPQRGLKTSQSLALKRLTMSGFYEVRSDQTSLAFLAVNVDKQESDTRKVEQETLEQFWKRLNISPSSIQVVEPDDRMHSRILESRFGIELWKYFIGVALLLALLEMAIARDSRKAMAEFAT